VPAGEKGGCCRRPNDLGLVAHRTFERGTRFARREVSEAGRAGGADPRVRITRERGDELRGGRGIVARSERRGSDDTNTGIRSLQARADVDGARLLLRVRGGRPRAEGQRSRRQDPETERRAIHLITICRNGGGSQMRARGEGEVEGDGESEGEGEGDVEGDVESEGEPRTATPPRVTANGPTPPETSLRELALLFFRLGATAFGGPAAHIAMMQDEVVRRRKWLTDERFLDLLGATNMIPGPNSTEMAIHIGWERRGWAGLVVAGVAFIVPAMLITAVCGWAYVSYGALPEVSWILDGIKPAILAVVVQAIWGLAPKAARTNALRIAAAAVIVLALFGADEIALLFGTGAVFAIGAAVRRKPPSPKVSGPPEVSGPPDAPTNERAPQWLPFGLAGAGAAASAVTLPSLFWVFLKIGSVLFGSGYVLLAFLRGDLVERLGWLTEAQLLDAIAVGQVTPGPVFTTATFIGYVLAGPAGALVATIGIFLPAFVFVALSGPLVPRLRASPVAGAMLDGVNVASLALMLTVTVELGVAALTTPWAIAVAALSAVLLVRYRVSSVWVIALGAAAGTLAHLIGAA
jgi:chromate transporter